MSRFKIFVSVVLLVLATGLITLGVLQRRTNQALEELTQPRYQNLTTGLTLESDLSATQSTVISDEALNSLQASLSALLAQIEALQQAEPQVTTVTTPTTSVTTIFQPQVIYLGSSSTQNRNWTDSGIEVVINAADYPSDVNAVFEAGLSIVGGEAWARLRNKSTGAVMPITEVSHNNSTVAWKNSPSFKFHPGNNTYVLQLKSTSGETASLSGARLRISR